MEVIPKTVDMQCFGRFTMRNFMMTPFWYLFIDEFTNGWGIDHPYNNAQLSNDNNW